jgi:hypothetical protein
MRVSVHLMSLICLMHIHVNVHTPYTSSIVFIHVYMCQPSYYFTRLCFYKRDPNLRMETLTVSVIF